MERRGQGEREREEHTRVFKTLNPIKPLNPGF
jgi:hypothetical protein